MITNGLEKILPNKRLIAPIRFIAHLSFIYLLWKFFSIWCRNENSILHPYWTLLHDVTAQALIFASRYVLTLLLSTDVFIMPRIIMIKGTQGIYIANHCLAIPPMVIFTGFIIAYGGQLLKMLVFIPLGLLGIFLINTLRICLLALSNVYMNEYYYHLAHSYVYLTLTYGLIFIMLIWWMKHAESPTDS
jgi:exosortase/archaeosortase family protein